MKKKIMIIGPRQVGKSTLANLLNHTDKPLRKTQDAIFGEKTIDVPAAYLENTSYKYNEENAHFSLNFTLQKGSYATVVLEEILHKNIFE